MEMVHAAGSGVVLYIQGHEGRGIGLAAKLRAYALQLQVRTTRLATFGLSLSLSLSPSHPTSFYATRVLPCAMREVASRQLHVTLAYSKPLLLGINAWGWPGV
jgi:hypothetical protein